MGIGTSNGKASREEVDALELMRERAERQAQDCYAQQRIAEIASETRGLSNRLEGVGVLVSSLERQLVQHASELAATGKQLAELRNVKFWLVATVAAVELLSKCGAIWPTIKGFF